MFIFGFRKPPLAQKGHVVFAVVRQEADFLTEWLDYHTWLGYDHFYLFNQDEDKTVLNSILKDYVDTGTVTLTPWNVGEQATAYLEAMRLHSCRVNSFTFLDVDEFVTLPEHVTLSQALADIGLLTKNKCAELSWWQYGDAGVDSNATRRDGVLQTLKRRSRSIATEHPGKVILRGGAHSRFHFLATYKFIKPGWWHRCDKFVSKRYIVSVVPEKAYLAHFQFRYGNESFIMRLKRGTGGDFKGQSMYAMSWAAKHYASRNEVFDDSLSRRFELVKKQKLYHVG